jgi:hypothetical protein
MQPTIANLVALPAINALERLTFAIHAITHRIGYLMATTVSVMSVQGFTMTGQVMSARNATTAAKHVMEEPVLIA